MTLVPDSSQMLIEEIIRLRAEVARLEALTQRLAYNPGFGMLNKAGMEEYLSTFDPGQRPFAVFFADGDDFKVWNTIGALLDPDAYAFANRVVKYAFADMRGQDIVAGQKESGDEWWGIVMPRTEDGVLDAEAALRRVAERMRTYPYTKQERAAILEVTGDSHFACTFTAAVVYGATDVVAARTIANGAVMRAKSEGRKGTITTVIV